MASAFPVKSDQGNPTRVMTRARKTLSEINSNLMMTRQRQRSLVDKSMPHSMKPEALIKQFEVDTLMEYESTPTTSLVEQFTSSRDSLRETLMASDEAINFEEIEEDDEDNPVMMTQYVVQIFDYLSLRELSVLPLAERFVDQPGVKFTPRMRYILVDWLVQVSSKFNLIPESLHLAIGMMDRYFQRKCSSVLKDDMQLIGVTCLYLASKYEELYPPEIDDFVHVTDNAYSVKDVRKFEITLLETIDFYLSMPLPIIFLRRYSRLANLTSEMHNAAKYLCELTLQEYDLCHLPASQRAAAAVCLSLLLFDDQQSTEAEAVWTPLLQFHSGLSADRINETIRAMASAAFRQNSPSKFRAVHSKYAHKDLLCVSCSSEMSSALLHDIASM